MKKLAENTTDTINEDISKESELILKLRPLPESDIFEFMQNLRGGTFFNMGMYSAIPVAGAYKPTIRMYKVIDLAAIVSGVSYENIGTTKDFRSTTGETAGKSWYDHMPDFENKVGLKKSDPNCKYVLWDVKAGTNTSVRYYVVDIATGDVNPVTHSEVENSIYLTASEKAKLKPRPVTGFDLNSGDLVENKTIWRTAAFEHIFWLSQQGKNTKEYGTRFVENKIQSNNSEVLEEGLPTLDIFIDGNANVKTSLDDILSGASIKRTKNTLMAEEALVSTTDIAEDLNIVNSDVFIDKNINAKTKLDDVLSGAFNRKIPNNDLQESLTYRKHIVDNELFVDFD